MHKLLASTTGLIGYLIPNAIPSIIDTAIKFNPEAPQIRIVALSPSGADYLSVSLSRDHDDTHLGLQDRWEGVCHSGRFNNASMKALVDQATLLADYFPYREEQGWSLHAFDVSSCVPEALN